MNRVRFFSLAILLVLFSGTFSSCAVFEPIGDFLSQLYDNSVSYFNAYYNAQIVFEEAETAVLASQRDVTAKAILTQKPAAPPAIPRDKFTAVIDKCSSILSFYPNSAVADDAVMLIGKSYFYQQEYLKAERKFAELLSQYPNSSLLSECQLWFAKTLERLRKQDEAEIAATQVAQDAVEEDDSKIAAEAFTLLGSMAEQESNRARALEFYSQALNFTDDGYAIASLYVKLGDLQFALQEYEKANASYMSVYEEGVPDIALNFYSRFQTIKGYAALILYDTATYLSEEMLEDYRFAAYHPLVRLEYAGILLASGYPEDALSEYQFMDSTYARTENGANASYRLAEYYERQAGDYSRAASYYGKAGGVQGATVSAGARKRENALLRIVAAHRELARNDSLVALSDSARKYPENFLKLVPADTVSLVVDSTGINSDSAKILPSTPQYVVTFKPLNADSMQTLRAKSAYDLGEIYYAEVEFPDSALTWFQKALDWKVDSTLAPRTLFILAELKQNHQKAAESEITEIYRTIVDNYPWSSYANEVRRILGMQISEQTSNFLDHEYAVAESLLWAGDYNSAIVQLKAIAAENPRSELAAKSQYALGWIYEYQLGKPDSALYYYRAIAEEHQASPYAAAIRNKLAGTAQENKESQVPSAPQQQSKPGETAKVIPERDTAPTEPDEGPLRRRLPQGRRAAPDSSKVRVD